MSKKEKVDDLEDDFDLDDLGFDDDFGDPFEEGGDREPKLKETGKMLAKETAKGFASGLYKKTTERALPDQFIYNLSDVKDYADVIKDAADESAGLIKKSMFGLGKEVKKILPFQVKALDNFIENYQSEHEQVKTQTEEQIRDNLILGSINDIFEKQLEVQQGMEARKEAQETVDKVRDRSERLESTKLLSELLRSIDRSSSQQTAFTLQISKEYFKKSLELQYKSFFVQADLLKTTKEHFKIFSGQLDSIKVNTGLPDYVKLNNSEHVISTIKKNMSDSIYKSLFERNQYVTDVKTKLNKFIVNKVKDTTSKVDDLTGMLNMMNDAEESGGGSALGLLGGTLSGIGGSVLGEIVTKLIPEDKLDSFKKNKRVQAADNLLATLANDPATFFSTMTNKVSKLRDESEEDVSLYGDLKTKGLSFIEDFMKTTTSISGLKHKVTGTSILDHAKPAIFDIRTHRSINEVIPMYLSNILKQNTILTKAYITRHGKALNKSGFGDGNVEELVYDFEGRKLTTKSQFKENVQSMLTKGRGGVRTARLTDTLFSTIRSHDASMKQMLDRKETKDKMNKFIGKANEVTGQALTTEDFLNPSPVLKTLIDKDPVIKSIFRSINVSKDNLTKSERERLDSSVRDLNLTYPIKEIVELFKGVSEITKGVNSPSQEAANAIAQSWLINIQELSRAIIPDDIITNKLFSRLTEEQLEIPGLEDNLIVFVRQVNMIQRSEDVANQTKLLRLISNVNRVLMSEFQVRPEVLQTLHLFSNDLVKIGKVDAIQLSTGSLDRTTDDMKYIGTDRLKRISKVTRAGFEEVLKKTTNTANENMFKKAFNTTGDFITKGSKELTEAKGISAKLNVLTRLTKEASKATSDVFKNQLNRAKEASNKLVDSLNTMTDDLKAKTADVVVSGIRKQLSNFIDSLESTKQKDIDAFNEETAKLRVIILEQDEETAKRLESRLKLSESYHKSKQKNLSDAIKTLNGLRVDLDKLALEIKEQPSTDLLSKLNSLKTTLTSNLNKIKSTVDNITSREEEIERQLTEKSAA